MRAIFVVLPILNRGGRNILVGGLPSLKRMVNKDDNTSRGFSSSSSSSYVDETSDSHIYALIKADGQSRWQHKQSGRLHHQYHPTKLMCWWNYDDNLSVWWHNNQTLRIIDFVLFPWLSVILDQNCIISIQWSPHRPDWLTKFRANCNVIITGGSYDHRSYKNLDQCWRIIHHCCFDQISKLAFIFIPINQISLVS